MTIPRNVLAILILLVLAAAALSVAALGDARQRARALEAERSLAPTRHGSTEYVRWGEGSPVLVVHGAGGGFDQGRLLAQALGGPGHDYIAVSRFGYLGSALPGDASPEAQAEAFADLLDSLDVERADIIAMSGGVPPSLKFAELHPQRTRRMALLSSAPFTPFSPDVEGRPVPTWAYKALLGNDVMYWVLTRIARRQLEEAFDARADLIAGLPADEREFVSALIDGFLPASRRVAGVANEGAAVDPAAVYGLERISAPALVVHARDDRLNPFAVGETIAARLPQAQFVALDRGGRLPLGHHAALRAEIEGFLNE